jgi:hypothetical protein
LFGGVAGIFHLGTVLGAADKAELGVFQTFVCIEALVVGGPNKLVVAVLTN